MSSPLPPASVTCPTCGARLPIALERTPEQGGRFPCPSCKGTVDVPSKAVLMSRLQLAAQALAAQAAEGANPGAEMASSAVVPGPAPDSADESVGRYSVSQPGAGVEEYDRLQLRDLIRTGVITEKTDIAVPGTREWKPAASFPELARYFALADEGRRIVFSRPSAASFREPMKARLVHGLAYPFKGGAILTLLGVAVLAQIPFFWVLAIPVATAYVLGVIRESAAGHTEMPWYFDTADIVGMLLAWLKTLAISLVALAPVLLWLVYGLVNRPDWFGLGVFWTVGLGLAVTGLAGATYYPACLATVAVFDSALDSLNPSYVARVIRIVGVDYAIVIAAWAVASLGGFLAAMFLNALVGFVPFLGAVPGKIASLWAQLYTAHLLGWAIHRHTVELGWE